MYRYQWLPSTLMFPLALMSCDAAEDETAEYGLVATVSEDVSVIDEDGDGLCKAEFFLANETGRDLVINRLISSCGCTHAKASEVELSPGGQTEIEVGVELRGSGYKRETVSVVWTGDSGDQQVLQLFISAQATDKSFFSCDPSFVELASEKGSASDTLTGNTLVSFFHTGEKLASLDIVARDVETSVQEVSNKKDKHGLWKQVFKVTISCDPPKRGSTQEHTIRLGPLPAESTHKETYIKAIASRPWPVGPSTESIFLGELKVDEVAEVELVHAPGFAGELVEVSCIDGGVLAQVLNSKDGGIVLRLSIDEGVIGGSGRENVIIDTEIQFSVSEGGLIEDYAIPVLGLYGQ